MAKSTQFLKCGWTVAIMAAAVLATACGGEGDTDAAAPQGPISTKPIDYVGRQAKVCGTVVETIHEAQHAQSVLPGSDTVTFLNFDRTLVSWLDFETEDPDFLVFFRGKTKRQVGSTVPWPDIEDPSIDLAGGWFDGKKICVSGRIREYRDQAAILMQDYGRIEFLEE